MVLVLIGGTALGIWWGRATALRAAETRLPLVPAPARVEGFRAVLAYGPLPALNAAGTEVSPTPEAALGIEASDCARRVELVKTAGRAGCIPTGTRR